MLKLVLIAFLPFLLFFGDSSDTGSASKKVDGATGSLKKMIPESGTVSIELNMDRLPGIASRRDAGSSTFTFSVNEASFMPILVFDGELRAPLPGSIKMNPDTRAGLTGHFGQSYSNLVLEGLPWGSEFEMVIRDGTTGFVFFGIEGQGYEFDSASSVFKLSDGRLVLSKEFAAELKRPADERAHVGTISVSAEIRTIEITELYNGGIQSSVLPASPDAGTRPGPDVVVGDLFGLAQFGSSSGTQVGLAVGTDSCNFGTVNLDWFANPTNNHPVIPQNLYRMSGGPNNDQRFEQIGQSSVKHAFTALTQNICGLGCNGVGGTRLGSGCSDPYSASLNAGGSSGLGSRAWINPFTGAYPRNDGATPNNSHTGHTHTGPSHKILVEIPDLNTSLNAGATYYAEGQYVTPHEYVWCQANPGQCNMNNNVSYRRYTVTGTGSPFTFQSGFSTEREKAAVVAWTGSTQVKIEPAPGVDGVGTFAYKVTNPSPGVWHYEYAIYNQNMDRGIGSFSMPMGAPVSLSNIGFHAPPQHPGWNLDGTVGNAGYSSTPWSSVRNAGDFAWSTETFAQNPNANAVRWGTLYNYRFDASHAPALRLVTIGFFKTGAPITMLVQVPTAMVSVSGRVMNGERGVANARVSIVDGNGFAAVATSDRFGNYQFDSVPSGGMYTITVSQRRFTFDPQTIPVNDTVVGANISAIF